MSMNLNLIPPKAYQPRKVPTAPTFFEGFVLNQGVEKRMVFWSVLTLHNHGSVKKWVYLPISSYLSNIKPFPSGTMIMGDRRKRF